MEEMFHSYEEKVLPLLEKHNGNLIYRVRLSESNFIEATGEKPYEIHLLSFVTEADFERFRQDEERKKYAPLFLESVQKTILIEGQVK